MRDPFIAISTKIASNPKISPRAKAVYLALAVHRDWWTDRCWPSNARLVEYTGLSRATVKRALRELLEAGVIERQERYVEGRQTTSMTTVGGVTSDPGGWVTSEPPGGVTSEPQNKNKRNEIQKEQVAQGDSRSHVIWEETEKTTYDPDDPETWWAYDGPLASRDSAGLRSSDSVTEGDLS